MILVVGLAIIAGGPAMAQNKNTDTAEYDTSRTLEYLGNDCMGVQDCVTIKGPRTRVNVGQKRVDRDAMPEYPPPYHRLGHQPE